MKLTATEIAHGARLVDEQLAAIAADGGYCEVIQRLGPVAVVDTELGQALIDPLGIVDVLRRMQPEPPHLRVVR